MREKRRFDAGETSLRCERNGTSKEICDTVAHLFACPTAERDLCNMENENEVRSRAVNLLLERGARFVVPLPRPYARLIPKRWRTMTIRHLKAGTILEIERLVVQHNLNNDPLTPRIELLAEAIALAVLNNRRSIRFLRRPLTRLLLWGVSGESLLELFGIVRTLNRLEDFTAITVWILLTARMTQMRTGQEEKGS